MKFLGSAARVLAYLVAVMVTTSTFVVAAPETPAVQSPPEPIIQPILAGEVQSQPQLGETLVATANQDTIQVFNSPGGEVTQTLEQLPVTYHQANPLVFVVVSDQDGWLEVMLPVRPNESIGWIWSSDVSLGWVDMSIVSDLSDRTLCATKILATYGSEIELTRCFPIAIGTADAPTPVGQFFIESWLELPNSPIFGPYQLILSAHSDTEVTFMGGTGTIGIHGTNQPELIGSAVSHGCIRMNNADITALIAFGVTPGVLVTVQP